MNTFKNISIWQPSRGRLWKMVVMWKASFIPLTHGLCQCTSTVHQTLYCSEWNCRLVGVTCWHVITMSQASLTFAPISKVFHPFKVDKWLPTGDRKFLVRLLKRWSMLNCVVLNIDKKVLFNRRKSELWWRTWDHIRSHLVFYLRRASLHLKFIYLMPIARGVCWCTSATIFHNKYILYGFKIKSSV